MNGSSEKGTRHTVRALIGLTRADVAGIRGRVAIVLVLSVSLVGPAVATPYLLGAATDIVIRSLPGSAGNDPLIGPLATVLGAVVGIALVAALVNFTRDRILFRLIEDWNRAVRARLVDIFNRSPASLDRTPPGDLLSRCVTDLDNLTRTATQSLSSAATAVVSIVGSLAVMLWLDPWFPIIAIATLAATAFVGQVLARRARPHFERQMQEYGNLTGVVLDAYRGRDSYRIGRNAAGLNAQLTDVDERLSANAFHAARLSGAVGPAAAVLDSIGFVVIVVLGAFRIASGSLTVGEVQASIQYFRQATGPVGTLTALLYSLQQAMTSARRVLEVLRCGDDPAADTGDPAVAEQAGPLTVSFEDVSFGYDGVPVLDGFSLVLPAGSHTALTGPSGAGKSTLINLLQRLLRPTGGVIRLSGQNLDEMPREQLVEQVAVVPQEPWIFTGTIAENIRCMRSAITAERVREAGGRCGLDRYVAALPDGYETVVSADGHELPGNARRLVGIARALAGTPGLVLLDEPTAGMDPLSAAEVESLIADQFRDVTVLVVSHRGSTVAALDRTVLLENGRVVSPATADEQ
ncbi:putative multidrug ABC transporter permease/ATP-binding protein [Gordonia araii NBRC 100433]|uniref:Putative multidrug ABC transporter permease/ATP-binding protein n=1 Tax=Gordonia araii NBRC 100433 TaxID=1073574 RepID=G7H2M2_9ACTN|nr:ABC transporter ATP-binding protein [Gordonia araii]NNG97754.1 ABC transporter ATP-binding protein [Gordonia araii NBRC 100433]GAB10097.1 putative multidrug ABC transporter permease/ATP-binding protein [Gordonia araii NBRC 100433]